MDELPTEIPNMQLTYVLAYLRDFHYSVAKSQAADQADGFVVAADMRRLKDRIADLKVQWEFIATLPLLDCPETHGVLQHTVPILEELSVPENKDVQYIMNFINMMHFEIATCQSSRMITGIQEHDANRGREYLANVERFVLDYVEPRAVNDWPDAAPEETQVGAGRTGE